MSMFGKVVKSTVASQVIDQIKELLGKRELRPGDRLPPERQLAGMLGVSRPSLREALRALEYAGVLETRVGEGVFVADGESILDNNLQMAHLLKQYALEEMIEVRKIIETASVRFAMERAREEDLDVLREVHEASRASLDDMAAFIQTDFDFHHALAVASGNSILVTMLQTMRRMMSDFNVQLLTTRDGREKVRAHHEEILATLAAGDRDAAVEALERHLDNVVATMKASTPRDEEKNGAH